MQTTIALFLAVSGIIGGAFEDTVYYVAESSATPVEAYISPEIAPQLTIEQKIDNIASKWKIASSTLYNLVQGESQFDLLADNGVDRGLVQISRKYWPDITDEQAFDVDFSLNFAAEAISKGKENQWVVCSCVSFARALGAKLPKGNADDLFPNTETPSIGGVLILKYKNGRHHLAAITKNTIQADGYHITTANKEPCKVISEVIPFDSKLIMGIYKYGAQ